MIDMPNRRESPAMNSFQQDSPSDNYLRYPWVFTSKPPTTTPPPSIMDTIFKPFEPFMLPFKQQLDKVTRDQSLFTNFLEGKPLPPLNSNSPRKSPSKPNSPQNSLPTSPPTYPNALSTLLEPLGMNAKPREEIQIGRDKSLSVLGMPVGRRDGLQLSPLQGLSLGGQNMYGPIAVNDKYSVNWNFLDGIGKLFGGDI
ncbi:unnamed protein product [Bursaphelenchus xylophilus]|nr:unnamed protein product [Bursaphelenchus xylophilus]CAG9109400.1 unnamed protein product [Bursaphelenchus xylophilus]